jgi:hypothetical protein
MATNDVLFWIFSGIFILAFAILLKTSFALKNNIRISEFDRSPVRTFKNVIWSIILYILSVVYFIYQYFSFYNSVILIFLSIAYIGIFFVCTVMLPSMLDIADRKRLEKWIKENDAKEALKNEGRQKQEKEDREKEQARRSTWEREQENQRHQEKKNNNRNNNEYKSTDLKDALELFELSQPYSLKDLQKRRKQLLLRVHPDHGGSNMMARMVNDAFDLLKSKI